MYSYAVSRGLPMAVILVASSTAIARDISYDYVQGTYSSVSNSTFPNDVDGDRIGVSGSLAVTKSMAITVGLNSTDYDRDIDTSQFALGVTLHAPIAVGTDVVFGLSALKEEIEIKSADDSDTGAAVSLGMRHLITDTIEFDAGISYTEIFDDDFTEYGFGARFYANDQISIGVGYAVEDDVDTLLLNARFDLSL
ncbi:MAG: outer membrane beta-barrel protein [Gammaproteobacteria bacterium]|nr:outer membrane beta-barrel protein [Gammaproteobacteria bacterium]